MNSREIPTCIYCHNRDPQTLGVGILCSGDPKTDPITLIVECLDTDSCISDVREMMGI